MEKRPFLDLRVMALVQTGRSRDLRLTPLPILPGQKQQHMVEFVRHQAPSPPFFRSASFA